MSGYFQVGPNGPNGPVKKKQPSYLTSVDEFMKQFTDRHRSEGTEIDLAFFIKENSEHGKKLKNDARMCWYAHRALVLCEGVCKKANEVSVDRPRSRRGIEKKSTVKNTMEPLYLAYYYFEDTPYDKATPEQVRHVIREHWFRFLEEREHPSDTKGNTPCVLCGKFRVHPTDKHGYELAHILSKCNKGKPRIDNLIPMCVSCNSEMGTTHMREYVETKHYETGWALIEAYLEYIHDLSTRVDLFLSLKT